MRLRDLLDISESDKNLTSELAVLVRKYKRNGKFEIYPDMIKGTTIDSIDDNEFENTGLVTVEIEEGITVIGDFAFRRCSKLKSVKIPMSVTSIGKGAFNGCPKLEVLGYAGSYAERYCNARKIHFWRIAEKDEPESMTFHSVPILDRNMLETLFTQDRLRYAKISVLNVDIPHGVQRIGNGVFEGWNIETVTVPNTVTDIGICAFKGSNLRSVTLPDSIIDIGDSAFANCHHLKSIKMPRNVVKINEDAFYSCWELKEVILNEGLQQIDIGAFMRCTALRNIVIPKSVAQIGEDAFSGCSNLESITILNPTAEITGDISHCRNRMANLTVHGYPNSTAEAFAKEYKYQFVLITEGSPQKKQVAMKLRDLVQCVNGNVTVSTEMNGVRIDKIENQAFIGCHAFESVEIMRGITVIGDFAFWDCTNLKRVRIPDTIISIGECAFAGCNKLVAEVQAGSYAEGYCQKHNIKFIPLS